MGRPVPGPKDRPLYMRARWYDPNTGELLSVDPDFDQTLDAYGYSDENPMDGTGSSGLMMLVGGWRLWRCYLWDCDSVPDKLQGLLATAPLAKATPAQLNAVETAVGNEPCRGTSFGPDGLGRKNGQPGSSTIIEFPRCMCERGTIFACVWVRPGELEILRHTRYAGPSRPQQR